VFAKAVNILGGRIPTIKNTEVIVVAVKKSAADVNAEKTYFAISRPAGGKKITARMYVINHSKKWDSSDTGTIPTQQNSVHEEIEIRMNSGNACYHSRQHLLSSSLLSKNIQIKVYKTIILPVVLYRCEAWSLT
jgi:hypothetical protein